MDNKRGTVPGYGRGRAIWRNNFDNTVNRPAGYLAPREWHQRFGPNVFGRGQPPFGAMFNGNSTIPPFITQGAKFNNSSIGKNTRRGNLSWADIRQQSQWNGFEMTLEDTTFQPDKPHHYYNRSGYMDGPWGGRGRGILEKINSDEEGSCHSNENNIWGGRGRGSILGAPKNNSDSSYFRPKSSTVGDLNKSHSGQFRGRPVKNQNIYASNKRQQMPRPMPMPMAMPITFPVPLPLLFDNLDLNFTCGKQEQNNPKKKQQQRKNWRKGRKAGSSGEDGSGRSAKNVGESSLQSSVSFEDQRKYTETDKEKDREKSVLPNKKRLVIINGPVENSVKIQDVSDTSKSHYESVGVKEKLIKRGNDTVSNEQKSSAEQPLESCKTPSDCSNKPNMLIRESTIDKEGAAATGIVKPLFEIINPRTDDGKDEQKSDQK